MQHYDLIIIGGGVVGSGFALALQSLPLKIALIDAKIPSNDDARLFALNEGSCQFLKNLDLWPALAAYAAPIHQVHVSNRGHFGAVRLNAHDAGLPQLGYVIPAKYIESALNETLAHSTVDIYQPARLNSVVQTDSVVTLEVATAEKVIKLQAPLVVGADGTESTVRQQLKITADIHDYGQSAIVFRTRLNRSHGQTAYERFTTEGAIAMLPLTGDECASIWSVEQTKAQTLIALSDRDFLKTLQQAFGYRLGKFQSVSPRATYPLRMVMAEKQVVGNVFLLGNAAHTIHPIAAQGFNLALYEVAALVEGMANMLQQNKPLRSQDLESIYATATQHQATSVGFSHRLSEIFGAQSRIPAALLGLGLVGLDNIPPIKAKLLTTLLGRAGNVPALLLKKPA